MNSDSLQRIVVAGFVLFIIILLVIFLVSTLSSDDAESNTPADATSVVPSDQQITLIWWGLFESQENMQPVIDAYQAIHPNVKIEYSEKFLEDYQFSLDQVLIDEQPATTPDIFTVHNTWMGRYDGYLIAAPIEVTDAAAFENDFYPAVNQDMIIDGVPKGIPLGLDSLALIYNKDLIEERGYTIPSDSWDELFDQAKALTKQNATGGFTQYGLSMSSTAANEFWFDILNLLFMQSEIQMVDQTGTEATFSKDPASRDAIDYFSSYVDKDIYNPRAKQDIALFLEEKLAMYIAPSWRLSEIITYNEIYELGINYDVAEMPQLSTIEDEYVGWMTYWPQVVAADSANYKVAWDFLYFAAQPDQLRLAYDDASQIRPFGQLYPRKDMQVELQEDQYLSPYVKQLSIAKSWQMVDGIAVKAAFKTWIEDSTSPDTAEVAVNGILLFDGELIPE